jgi:hypothetical protein
MSLQAYRDEYARIAGSASYGEQQTNGLSAGQYTQYFSLTPKNGKANSFGVFVKFVGVLTASGAATPTAGTDNLDLYLGGGGDIELSPAAGAAMRAQAITRQFMEFLWVASTNVNVSVAAAPTFASAGTSTVTTYLYVPCGGNAGVLKAKLAGNITGVYSSNVTIAYTSVTTYILSSNFAGVAAFKEELTASLGTQLQSVLNYVPQTVSPDAIFLKGETSATITFLSMATIDGLVFINSADTDVLQLGAQAFAPISGVTYTTSAGFVICGDQKAFSQIQMTFASATTHNIGYFQMAGGSDVVPSPSASPTAAPAAVNQTGTVTASGQVAAGNAISTSNVAAGKGGGSGRPP